MRRRLVRGGLLGTLAAVVALLLGAPFLLAAAAGALAGAWLS